MVCQELHFGRAGTRLGVSTSRVSQQISLLERRLSTTLFERTSRQVQLTPHGEHLLREVRPAYDAIQQALYDVRGTAGGGKRTLRVGFASALPAALSQVLIRRFEHRHPHTRVIQSAHPTADLAGWAGGQWPVDVFVTWMPERDADQAVPHTHHGPVITRTARVAAIADAHPLATRHVIDYEELADHRVIHLALGLSDQYSHAWTPPLTATGRPVPLRTVVGRTYLEEVMRIVTDEHAVHITVESLPARCHFPGITYVPLTGLPPMPVRAIWPATSHHPLIRPFTRLAADHPTA